MGALRAGAECRRAASDHAPRPRPAGTSGSPESPKPRTPGSRTSEFPVSRASMIPGLRISETFVFGPSSPGLRASSFRFRFRFQPPGFRFRASSFRFRASGPPGLRASGPPGLREWCTPSARPEQAMRAQGIHACRIRVQIHLVRSRTRRCTPQGHFTAPMSEWMRGLSGWVSGGDVGMGLSPGPASCQTRSRNHQQVPACRASC